MDKAGGKKDLEKKKTEQEDKKEEWKIETEDLKKNDTKKVKRTREYDKKNGYKHFSWSLRTYKRDRSIVGTGKFCRLEHIAFVLKHIETHMR
jgi:hypothetical protein